MPLTKFFWKKHSRKSTRKILEEIAKLLLRDDIGRLAIEDYL